MRNSTLPLTLGLLMLCPLPGYAQCSPGIITKAHTNTVYDALLDPDGDGYITESGAVFTSGTTEMAEFETIPNSTSGWFEVPDVSEVDSDITPNCGNPDLIQDADGGDYAFFNIIDPTPGIPTSGDEYILLRFRLAQPPQGNFGYNFLVDTDASFGAGVDTNSTCGNAGFEREVQFANKGGKQGVSVYDVDGATALGAAICNQCVSVADVQNACAASSGNCGTSDPQFVTVPLPLVHLGVPSNIDPLDLYIMVATASSGNATSVLGGGNVTDLGSLNDKEDGCGCAAQSGCAQFDCQSSCIQQVYASLPVTFTQFEAEVFPADVRLQWDITTDARNGHFYLEHSTDGVHFSTLRHFIGNQFTRQSGGYNYVHRSPAAGLNYYRVKQIDFDGFYRYSPIASINFGPERTLDFALVPSLHAGGPLELEIFHASPETAVVLSVFDLSGRVVLQQDSAGDRMIALNVDSLNPGAYLVRVHDGIDFATRRFLKL
ncbi:T9SS type A sorting domain-containing protein [Lewinella sp. JB7]|uniref:T9SS type A sorting domain-containing protein n=1 Tax=Lewinella sp. JB7 TaxID=2962887 RepID=UPI0020C97A86|nr:T9SS type A sorting domain-containing protein [Lewinella sp. JB7]MCP9237427.1 T9SS type A sorting domain-containing protein [Lewinella sp. JB7]